VAGFEDEDDDEDEYEAPCERRTCGFHPHPDRNVLMASRRLTTSSI
jgi:hypothetical protein